jgi:hypothetical protein
MTRIGVPGLVFLAVALILAAAILRVRIKGPAGSGELAPPGTYSSFEEAGRAAGFKIPHLRPFPGWVLTKIDVSGPDYGSFDGPIERAQINQVRFVDLKYSSEADANKSFSISAYRDPKGELKPSDGGGDATHATIRGRQTILQQKTFGDGRVSFFFATWRQDEIAVSAHAFLSDRLIVEGKTIDVGLSRDEMLAILAAID